MNLRLSDSVAIEGYVDLFGVDSGIIFHVELDRVRASLHDLVLNKKEKYFSFYFTFTDEFGFLFLTAFYLVDRYNDKIKSLYEFKSNPEAFYTVFLFLWADYCVNKTTQKEIEYYKNKLKNECKVVESIKIFVRNNKDILANF